MAALREAVRTLRANGRDQDAVVLAKRGGVRDPGVPEILVLLANALTAAGRFDTAWRALEHALVLKLDHVDALAGRAVAHGRRGDWRKAAMDTRRALLVNPRHPRLWHLRASLAHRRLGVDTVLTALRRVSVLEDGSAAALLALANALNERADTEAALAVIRRALRQDRASIGVVRALATRLTMRATISSSSRAAKSPPARL